MNKKYLIVILIITGIFISSGCYTKKKGIVPCPHSYNTIKTKSIENIVIDNV
jgi:hypothetical protein